jgi:hypothetical protein
MKTLKLFVAAGLVLASSLAARAEISAQAWLETYYLNPQPAELGRSVLALSREGYFDKAENSAVAIGFLGTVFAQNPDRVEGWLAEFGALPNAHQRVIAAALWQAGNPAGGTLLRNLSQNSSVRAEVQRLAGKTALPIADTPVLSPSSMNLQWGAFLATGAERYVVNILYGIGMNQPALSSAARYALAQNAAAHPRVMEICNAELTKQPSGVRSVLQAALDDASRISRGPKI